MIEAELLLRVPQRWITEIPRRYGVSIRILGRKPSGKTGVRDLVEISGSQHDLEEVLKALESEPWIRSFDLDFVESGKLVGEVVTPKCLACATLAGSNCHLISANTHSDGTISWRVMTRDRDEVKKLVTRLRKAKCEVELSKLTPIDDREVLTGRQEEIIMMAFERGYFETPRMVKLKDLSRLTGVSQATLSEILRKGQKRIVVDFLRARRKSV
ncbi:MAG: hypothetical protein A3K60_08610 [Euryarchaeota archaeon RBG_19FT_COMBO_56_21]|nr:MAG: hypothetical protein A3K60_08610 [Euryarchaeota archaeon RBG_19FT_COMBO_56_21]